jgi:hypothetical protein
MIARHPSRSWLSSALAAEREDSSKTALRNENERDTLHDDIVVNPHVPSRSPPLQPTVEVAIAGLSCKPLDAEHTIEYPPHPHG